MRMSDPGAAERCQSLILRVPLTIGRNLASRKYRSTGNLDISHTTMDRHTLSGRFHGDSEGQLAYGLFRDG